MTDERTLQEQDTRLAELIAEVVAVAKRAGQRHDSSEIEAVTDELHQYIAEIRTAPAAESLQAVFVAGAEWRVSEAVGAALVERFDAVAEAQRRYPASAAVAEPEATAHDDQERWGRHLDVCERCRSGDYCVHGVALMDAADAAAAPVAEPPRELLCQRCNTEHPVWSADNDLWNQTLRRPDGSDEYHFLCPTCFVRLAAERGVTTAFRVSDAYLTVAEPPTRQPGFEATYREILLRLRGACYDRDSERVLDIREELDAHVLGKEAAT